MNTKRITDIFKRMLLPHVKMPLGRWNIHDSKETSLKIKYATEDNCGIYCYNHNGDNNKMKKNDDKEYMYMIGYESVH
jgi:hypothetical protein